VGVMEKAIGRLGLPRIALQRLREGCRRLVAQGLGQADQARAQAAIGQVDRAKFLLRPGVGGVGVHRRQPPGRPGAQRRTNVTALTAASGPRKRGAGQGCSAAAGDPRGGQPRTGGSSISPRRASSTSALRPLTSWTRPWAPRQSNQSHNRRDKALRLRPGSAATTSRRRSMIPAVNVCPKSLMRPYATSSTRPCSVCPIDSARREGVGESAACAAEVPLGRGGLNEFARIRYDEKRD
jgi:hypothetical protein